MAQPSNNWIATGYSNSYRIYVSVTVNSYNPITNSSSITFQLVADASGSQWFSGWPCTGYLNISYLNSSGVTTSSNWSENTSTNRSLSGAGGYYTAKTTTVTAYHNPDGSCSVTVAASYGMVNQSQTYSMPQRTLAATALTTGTTAATNLGLTQHSRWVWDSSSGKFVTRMTPQRRDSSTTWTPITIAKRYDGTAWVDID